MKVTGGEQEIVGGGLDALVGILHTFAVLWALPCLSNDLI